MIPRLHDKHYSRNLKAAIICSLLLILLLFTFFPRIKYQSKKVVDPAVLFYVEDVPVTVQTQRNRGKEYGSPTLPPIKIPDINDRPELLEDAEITSSTLISKNDNSISESKTRQTSMGNKSFMPRQIKEVLPKKIGSGINGYIKLSLMIGKDGKVEKHIIVANTTNNTACLEDVLDAVYRSRWQVVKVNGNNIGYWVEKTYNFK